MCRAELIVPVVTNAEVAVDYQGRPAEPVIPHRMTVQRRLEMERPQVLVNLARLREELEHAQAA